MTRNEILTLAIKSGKVRFDEEICNNFDWRDFDDEKFSYYLKRAGISYNLPKGLLRNNVNRIYAVILFANKAKNAGIATLRRVFLTQLASKRTSRNVQVIS